MIIGICGATCSGKSTLTNIIPEKIPIKIVTISQDDFYKSEFEKVKGFDNWDSVSAFDFDRLCQAIDSLNDELKKNEKDQYIILVEGILLLEDQVASKFDKIFFIDIPEEVCRKRRLDRDEWLRENEEYFDLCIWPCYQKYGHYSNISDKLKDRVVIFDGKKDIDVIANEICSHIKSIMNIK